MGIIQEMLTQDHEKKQTIDRKVSEQHILPTQVEQQKANDVIRIISEKYADKLKDHSILSRMFFLYTFEGNWSNSETKHPWH